MCRSFCRDVLCAVMCAVRYAPWGVCCARRRCTVMCAVVCWVRYPRRGRGRCGRACKIWRVIAINPCSVMELLHDCYTARDRSLLDRWRQRGLRPGETDATDRPYLLTESRPRQTDERGRVAALPCAVAVVRRVCASLFLNETRPFTPSGLPRSSVSLAVK